MKSYVLLIGTLTSLEHNTLEHLLFPLKMMMKCIEEEKENKSILILHCTKIFQTTDTA